MSEQDCILIFPQECGNTARIPAKINSRGKIWVIGKGQRNRIRQENGFNDLSPLKKGAQGKLVIGEYSKTITIVGITYDGRKKIIQT